MSIHKSRSEDSFLKLHINPTIPESPTIDDFKQVSEAFENIEATPKINKEALESFLNFFKQT